MTHVTSFVRINRDSKRNEAGALAGGSNQLPPGRFPRRAAGLGDDELAGRSLLDGDAGARHLLDLPEGYHTTPRAQAWQDRPAVGWHAAPGVSCGRALPGRGDGTSAPGVRRSISGADHLSAPGSRWHSATRSRSSGVTGRHGPGVEIPARPL